jgi:hypothetical protein
MKKTFALFGLIGLVGCFLPMLLGFSLFEARHGNYLEVMLIMAAFAVPMFLGFADKLHPAASLIAAGCFGYIVWRFGFDIKTLIIHGEIGGKAIGISALAGLVTSLGSLGEKPAT